MSREEKIKPPCSCGGLNYDFMIEFAWRNFWEFCKLMDESGKVPTWKYADFVLYCFENNVRKIREEEGEVEESKYSELSDQELLKMLETGDVYKVRSLPILVEAIMRLLGNKIYNDL